MNKRKVTKRKGSKAIANNDPSEVFVLPPNLLEALGINLGNIENAPECTSGNHVSEKKHISREKSAGTPSNISENNVTTSSEKEPSFPKPAEKDLIFKENCTGQAYGPPGNIPETTEKESSIIQTANLMTASVFLSPTFISNKRSIIEGEVEIVGSAQLLDKATFKPNVSQKKNENDQSDHMTQGVILLQHQDAFSGSDLEYPNDVQSSEVIQETNKNVQSTDVRDINNIAEDINIRYFDDHADEAYSSDGSNVNVEMSDKSDGSNCSVLLPTHSSKKISIISEQILDPSQFKAFQSSYSDTNNSLIPVAMNTVLRSGNYYRSSINDDYEPKVSTYYVAPSETTESDLCDVNVCKNITDPNQELNENDYITQDAMNCDSLDSYFTHSILASVNESENIIMGMKMQEDSSQHAFDVCKSELDRHSVLPDTFNREDKSKIIETNISENTNTANYEDEKINETSQKVCPKTFEIQNFYLNCNILSSVSEDAAVSKQMQKEGSSLHAYVEHKNKFPNQLTLGDKFNGEDRDTTTAINISDIKNTNTTRVEEERLNEVSQTDNQKAIDEPNFYGRCYISYKSEDIAISKTGQGASQHAFEVQKRQVRTHLESPDTLNRGDNCTIMKTNIPDTKTTKTIVDQEIDMTLQKANPHALDEDNINVDNKHQELSTKPASDKLNETRQKASHDAGSKRKSNIYFVKDGKMNLNHKNNLSRNRINHNQDRSDTNLEKKKFKNKVMPIQVVRKKRKATKNQNTNLEIKDILVDVEAKPTRQSLETLHERSVPDNNPTVINCTTKTEGSVQLSRLGPKIDDQEAKIREIAGYLSKYAELQKQRKMLKEKQHLCSIKTFSNQNHTTNTKLLIQGVEKPGGSEKGKDRKNVKNIKTYERKRKNIPHVPILLKPNFDTNTQKINMSENTSNNSYNDTDLCLCDDFGGMKYFDDESICEKNHYWDRKPVDCTPDLIFSIYNENIPAKISTDDDTKNLQDHAYIPIEISSTPDHKVCWNEINFIDSQEFDEGSEHIVVSSEENVQNILLNIDKPNESSVDELTKPDASKCSNSKSKNTENVHKNAMVTVNQVENCQENNNIVPDVNPMQNEKKRKYSSTFDGNGKSPATQHISESELPARVEIVKKQKCSKNNAGKTVPGDQINSEGNSVVSLNNVTSAICGVCRQNIKDTDWLKHIASQHNYLSWRVDETPLDLNNRQLLIQHLSTLIKQYGVLSCNKCGTTRKYAKPFLHHINQCTTVEEFRSQNVSLSPSSEFGSKGNLVNHGGSSSLRHGGVKEPEPLRLVVCGVCAESMQDKDWISHIGSQHNYLAWKRGEQTLDVDDEDEVKEHLYNIAKECGGLECSKCGLTRKYVKSYLTHIKSCDGQNVTVSLNESTPNCSLHIVSEVEPARCVSDATNIINGDLGTELATDDLVKCGVCGEFMLSKDWNTHIGSQHNYLAWRHGQPALDVGDEAVVKEHLYNIMKECGGLECAKCGLTRKYVKSYLTHIRNCDGLSESISGCAVNASLDVSEIEDTQNFSALVSNISTDNEAEITDVDQCAVCGESMPQSDWYEHMGLKHHYLAWRCGDPELNLNDVEATDKHLHAIVKEYGGLKCVKCGLNRKYVKSYLTHVKRCTGPKMQQDHNLIADDSATSIVVLSGGEQHAGLSKCGVCGQYMPHADWTTHIESNHAYLAWKDDEPALDVNDKGEVREHLNNIVKHIGRLICPKCGMQRKFAKSYLQHIEKCDGSEKAANSSKVTDEVIWPAVGADHIKCGVCDEIVQNGLWIKHIGEQHDYLANKFGDTPLDLDDEEQVYKHLYNIVKKHGCLSCRICGTERKYVKSYLEHIRKCGQDTSLTGDTTFEANTSLDRSDSHVDFYTGGTCGVCQKEVEAGKWIQHIQKEHNYLAWRKGEKPWDLENNTEVNEYLYEITKKMGGLTCNKCGLVRKYVKSYLSHIKSCTVVDFNLSSMVPEGVGPVSGKDYRCAMCQKEIEPSKWKSHAMKEHYNVTWIIGETPIDLKNPYAVEKYLKEYKQYHSLKCNNCGATRASFAGFYAHVITCGKTEEQIEMFQSVCEICKNKYLCIYKNQHMMIHKVQEHSKELKMAKENKVEKEESVTSGRRQAAQKARSVIETYSSDMIQHKHKCSTCGFGTDFEAELQSHRCDQNEKDFSGEESSAAEEEGSEEESGDSEVDSDVSREEEEQAAPKRKRYKEPVSGGSKLSKIYFKVEDPNAFVEQSDIDFVKAFYTDDTLFTKWLYCDREVVSEDDLSKYLPPMKESCKVKAGFDWTKLKRFQAKNGDGTCIFVGGSIVCVAWVPPRVEDIFGDGRNFLAVACHNDVDCPRYQWDETPQHENLIQIWDFGTCRELPRIVYGIAHDFGTVWSMDWCPSGARSGVPGDSAEDQFCRLGLLVVACSNGSAYIFSVPHPSTVVTNNQFIHKLRPVAELRMKMLENSDRKVFQATSVTWSKQKGHDIILVGYADGSTGYFDVNSTSPLARRIEDNIEIFFPYSQERPHNTCITATDMVPCLWGGFVLCSASATGAELAAPGAGARVRSQLPARAAAFAPHWPAALLAGDVAIMNTAVNELEWAAPARKLGGVRALAGCARCGRVAAAAPPALRVMRPHPAYPEFKKPIFGMIEMIPLGKKRTKKVNDELGVKIEPLTYPDVISKYGIQFQSVSKRDKALQQQCSLKPKVHFPERFPLADVESMAFCPTKRHHDRLAVATHSGIVFFTTVNS